MEKVELLPTQGYEAGYGPAPNTMAGPVLTSDIGSEVLVKFWQYLE